MKARHEQEPRALREGLGSDDADLALAARLLRSPSPPSLRPLAEKRVWARLHLRQVGSRMTRAQVAATALVLLGMMTVASATIGRRFIERALGLSGQVDRSPVSPPARPVVEAHRPVSPPPPAADSTTARAISPEASGPRPITRPMSPPVLLRRTGELTRRSAPSPAGGGVATINPGPVLPVAPAPVAGTSTTRTPLEDDASEPAAPPPRSTAGDEENMAYADLLAVRRQHDMTRVVRMVRDHLSGFPHGQLREEFLTIGIEAATRGGDRPARHEFGQRYLDEFPTGLHRAHARRALEQQP